MSAPLISVLLPVYNAGDYLKPCIASVLSQTYRNIEVLIIDDGSTDGCLETLKEFSDTRIRVIRQAHGGKAVALNRGLLELRGEFYAIQDADDISYPSRLERQLNCMLANPELAGVFTGHDLIIHDRRVAPRFRAKTPAECKADIENFAMPAHDPTAIYRVEAVRQFTYEPSLIICQGLDYILRVGEVYPLMVLGECLYSYRVHVRSTVHRKAALIREMKTKVFIRACQRRGLDPTPLLSRRPSHQRNSVGSINDEIVSHFMESVLDLRQAGRVLEAIQTGLFCWCLKPSSFLFLKPLIYAIAPVTLIRFYRQAKQTRLSKKARLR